MSSRWCWFGYPAPGRSLNPSAGLAALGNSFRPDPPSVYTMAAEKNPDSPDIGWLRRTRLSEPVSLALRHRLSMGENIKAFLRFEGVESGFYQTAAEFYSFHSARKPELILVYSTHETSFQQQIMLRYVRIFASAANAAYLIRTNEIWNLDELFILSEPVPELRFPDPAFGHGVYEVCVNAANGGLKPIGLEAVPGEPVEAGFISFAALRPA